MSQDENHKREVLEKHFLEVMKRAAEIVGSKKQTDIAKAWLVKPNTLNGWKKRGFPDGVLYKFAYLHNLNHEWLDKGVGQKHKTETLEGENIITLEHMNVVKGFIDQPTALKFNKCLQVIEKLDNEEFNRMYEDAESVANYLERINKRGVYGGKNRRKGERRSEKDKSYDGVERRSGENRRNVS